MVRISKIIVSIHTSTGLIGSNGLPEISGCTSETISGCRGFTSVTSVMAVAADLTAAVVVVSGAAKASVDIDGAIAGVGAGVTLRGTGTGARLATVMALRTGLAVVIKSAD